MFINPSDFNYQFIIHRYKQSFQRSDLKFHFLYIDQFYEIQKRHRQAS